MGSRGARLLATTAVALLLLAGCGADDESGDGASAAALWLLTPTSVIRVAAADGVTQATLPVADAATGAAIAGGVSGVWVALKDGSVVHIDPATNEVAETVTAGTKPVQQRSVSVAPDGTAYVCDAQNGLSRISPGASSADQLDLGGAEGETRQCLAVAASDATLWVGIQVSEGPRLFRMDPATEALELALDAKVQADRLAPVGDGVITACTCGSELYRVTHDDDATFVVKGPVQDVEPVVEGAWYAGKLGIVYLDPSREFLGDGLVLEGERSYVHLTSGDGSMYAAGDNLHRIDPVTGETTVIARGPNTGGFGAVELAMTPAGGS